MREDGHRCVGSAERVCWRGSAAGRWLSVVLPLVAGALAVAAGPDTGWDLQNYWWYNPYAWLNGRLGTDIAVAHHATYHNPTIGIPAYLAAQILPAWVVGFLVGAVQGLNPVLLFWLAWTVLRVEPARLRFALSTAVAVAGFFGGGAVSMFGTLSYDNVVSLGIFAAMLVVARRAAAIFGGPARAAAKAAALAGLAAGAAVGLKLTAVSYAAGLGLALLVVGGPLRLRLAAVLGFGLGGAIGVAVCGGPWMVEVWRHTGSPLFPYFNEIFRSPLLSPDSHRDTGFIPTDPLVRLLFPLYFSFDPYLVAEYAFRDVKVLMAFVLVPAGLIAAAWPGRRPAAPFMAPLPARYLMVSAVIAYGVWLGLFCIYRYLIAWEMLAPLLLALALGALPLPNRWRAGLLALLLIAAQAGASRHDFSGFRRWGERYVAVQVPPLADPGDTVVLMAATAPMGYVVPSFPPRVAFLRIGGWLCMPDSGCDREIARRLRHHHGPLHVLMAPWQQGEAVTALARYDLDLAPAPCATVTANLGEPLSLCPVIRASAEAEASESGNAP